MTMEELKPGEIAKITGYAHGNGAYRAKLLALGLTRGVTIQIINVAPLGDPVELEVRGYNLSLRKSEASILNVELVKQEGK